MAKNTHLISKTGFIKGVQCPKQLYLYKYHYNEQDPKSPETLAKFECGTNIGKWAQQLFPNGLNLEPTSKFNYQEALKNTKLAIENKQPVLYEASFEFDGVLVIIDMLVLKDGKWHAFEVKSSHHVSEVFLYDISLQHYVITNSGIPLKDTSLVLLSENATPEKLTTPENDFQIISVKQEVENNQLYIARKLASLKETLAEKEIPKIAMGDQCLSPYTCDFLSFCRRQSIG